MRLEITITRGIEPNLVERQQAAGHRVRGRLTDPHRPRRARRRPLRSGRPEIVSRPAPRRRASAIACASSARPTPPRIAHLAHRRARARRRRQSAGRPRSRPTHRRQRCPLKLFAFLSKRPMGGNCVAPSRFRRQCAGPCRTTAMCGGEPLFRIERHGPEFLARRISGVAIFPCEGGPADAWLDRLKEGGRLILPFDGGRFSETICRKTNAGCARRAGAWLLVARTLARL
jgi:hypothetical protein